MFFNISLQAFSVKIIYKFILLRAKQNLKLLWILV